MPLTRTGILAIASSAILAACGGGGSETATSQTPTTLTPSEDTQNPTPDDTPISAPVTGPAQVSDAERTASWGYEAVGADAAYAAEARGQGTLIALIDGGVVEEEQGQDRVDFDQAVTDSSVDILDGEITNQFGTGGRDTDDHANRIASIMVSRADDRLLAGIAPEASLLSVDADIGCGDCLFFEDIRAGIDHAVSSDADVINLSLSSADSGGDFFGAVKRAAQADIVIAVAAGNEGGGLEVPANFLLGQDIKGHLIAVGSVREDLRISKFSARPGNLAEAEYFMVAPGEDVRASDAFGNLSVIEGTSFAAPHVSAGIAALSSAFPFMTGAELVDLVLSSARDLGDPGTDLVYGRGLLDLEEALQPQGSLNVAASDNSHFKAQDSALKLGPAFGDGGEAGKALAMVKGLDRFGRAFDAGLGGRVSPDQGGLLENQLTFLDDTLTRGGDQFASGSLAFTADDAQIDTGFASYLSTLQDKDKTGAQWRGRVAGGELRLGFDQAPQAIGLNHSEAALFAASQTMTAPELALAGRGHAMSYQIDGLGFAIQHGDGTQDGGDTAMLSTSFGLGSGLSFSHSLVLEDGQGLGSAGEGALKALGDAASSQFLTLRAAKKALGLDLSLNASLGMTDMSSNSALFDDWSRVWTSAMSVSASKRGVVTKADRLGILLGQPMRVESGSVRAILPTSQNADGTLNHQSQRITMTPSGREIRLDLVYDRPFSDAWSLRPWASLRHEPGHIESADDEAIAGVNARLSW